MKDAASRDCTALEVAAAVRRGACSALEIVDAALARIADDGCHAFLAVWGEEARTLARAVDERVAAGEDPGPLAGVPVAVKDNIVTRIGATTCGSRMLEGFRSPYDATAVQRVLGAGGVIVGKTNCDEFAMGSSTENSAFGPTRNPWHAERVPGGSSGGSAAAVAAGLVPLALGSDTGGSIRQPAAFTGVVGVKPTYGRVSRHGLVAFGSSLDQVGPIARTTADAALLLAVIAGDDAHDATAAPVPVELDLDAIRTPMRGMRLGRVANQLAQECAPEVAAAVDRALDAMRDAGAEIVDVELPLTACGVATYYVLAPAEASSNLARFDGVRYGHRAVAAPEDGLEELYARSRAEGFGPEVQRRIMLGTFVLSAGYHDAYYDRALRVRRLIAEEYARAFERCDAIVGPTAPTAAFALGAKPDPLSMYQCDIFTVNANIAGICAASIPCGTVVDDGVVLPVGLHLQCPAFAEAALLQVAHTIETQLGPWAGPPRKASRLDHDADDS